MKHLPLYILLLALFLRCLVSYQLWESPSVQSPSRVTDMCTYWRLSGEMMAGRLPDHYDYQPFYYSVFLPVARFLTGNHLAGVILLQAVMGAATVWLAWLAGGLLFGRRAGWIGAFLLAVDRVHVFYTPFLLLEVLQGFWLILILYVTCLAYKRNRTGLWLLDAVLLAFATLTRGNALLLMPGFLALLIYRRAQEHRSPRRWLKTSGLALAACVLFELPQFPFAWTNYRYLGRWCGASTAGDKVLALGNTPEAGPGGLEYPLTYHKWVGLSERSPQLGRVSVASQIARWAMKEPGAFAELKLRSLLLFWDKREIPNNVSLNQEGTRSWLIARPVLLPFAVIGFLAMLGLWLLAGRLFRYGFHRVYYLILLYMVLCSWFGTALFYNLARFRLSALPLLCVLGGAAIAWFLRLQSRIRQASPLLRKQLVYSAILLILVSFFIVNMAYKLYQENGLAAAMRYLRAQGVRCQFADECLVYDHGPLVEGGIALMATEENSVKVTKRFDLVGMKVKSPARVRIMVFPCGDINATLEHNGQVYPLSELNLVKDRFVTWLEVQLDTVNQAKPEFTWNFNSPQNLPFAVDNQRDYGRTWLDGQVIPAEAVAEIQWTIPAKGESGGIEQFTWVPHQSVVNCELEY